MNAQDHITAINRILAQISTARGELEAVERFGEKTAHELDALNAAENPDADQVQILESRLRGLAAKKSRHSEAITNAEAALYDAVDAGFNAVGSIAKSGPEFEAAVQAVLPWCNGSMETARKIALTLPTFRERAQQIYWLDCRRNKTDPEEFAPLLVRFFESLTAAPTAAAVAA